MIHIIETRRSIRKFKPDGVPKETIEKVIKAGMLAPSSKNRQPWQFIVTSGGSKRASMKMMEAGLKRERGSPLLPSSADYISSAEHTMHIMENSPVIIFIVNPLGLPLETSISAEDRIYEICNAQSIGAAIENMTLAATELGLGSLWICDTYFAQKELDEWLNTPGELVAALALGFADEAPAPRPRKNIKDIVRWLD